MGCDTNQEPLANAELVINGEKVALNDFLQGLISESLIGMVKSLRGVGEIETIELKISKNCHGQ